MIAEKRWRPDIIMRTLLAAIAAKKADPRRQVRRFRGVEILTFFPFISRARNPGAIRRHSVL